MSVFGTTTRTTSAIEAYNGVLGRIIPKHGNFFKFVKMLQNEEFSKGRELELLINSGGTYGTSRRKRSAIDKATKIEQAGIELQNGKITASGFLNRMVFAKNKTVYEMEPDEDIFEDIPYLDEEEDNEDGICETQQPPKSTDTKRQSNDCAICMGSQSNTLFLPCKHLKTCNSCVLKLQAAAIARGLDTIKCPICCQNVEDSMLVFW